MLVFLGEFVEVNFFTGVAKNFEKLPDEVFDNIEADSYWCLSKIIENV